MGRAVNFNAGLPQRPLAPRLNAIPREIVAACDYESFARSRLDDNAWAYLAGGAADELTLRENQEAFRKWRLNNRVLADVAGGHTRLTLAGLDLAHPVLLAPVAYQRLFHPDGELATVIGAAAMQTPMVVSTLATTPLEAIAQKAQAPLWFQLYMRRDRTQARGLVQRAEAAGYRALVVTVDAPLAGVRNREQRAGFRLPTGMRAMNLPPDMPLDLPNPAAGSSVFDSLMTQAPTWDDLEWLLGVSRLPVFIKGILAPQDAQRALAAGVAGIIVSNHGGRVLDTAQATLDALPAIMDAVGSAVPVLLDGGVRRGTDIFKALALGARAVLIGRPYIHALATAGALGVAHLVRLLREELEITMALTGCATLEAINRDTMIRGQGN
jgi:4-hydroxymandelate oxidase